MSSYWQVINYLLSPCKTDDIFAEGDMDIISYQKPQDFNAVDYLQSLCTKALG